MSPIGKIVHSNRFIRKVGLDSDVIIALVDDIDEFSQFRPRIFNKKNILHINHVVFSELLGHLIYKRKMQRKEAINKIFSYLRRNHITLIKKKEINLNEVEEIFEKLKKQKKILNNNSGDKDLRIISIYKTYNIDLIISRNSSHYEPFCQYLNIAFEKLLEDVDVMWRQAFGWQTRKKKKL